MSYRARDRLARRYERRFAETFVRSMDRVRERVTDDLVAEVMRGGLVDEPVALYALIDAQPLVKAGEADVYAELISEGAAMELRLQDQARFLSRLKVTSPWVLARARRYAANLVTRVNRETKAAIRQIVFEAIRDGRAPAVAARTIRNVVGLLPRHAVAVQRFAETHPTYTERGVARYARKLLNYRARMIARTESAMAAVGGRQEAWREMVRDNLIDTSRFRQVWLVTPDDRLCEFCAPMEGATVALDGSFESTERGILPSEREPYAGETVEGPPLHPSCRCDLVAEFE